MLGDINKGDAEDFRIWMQTEVKEVGDDDEPEGLARNTYRRRTGRTKQFFEAAVKRKKIKENPFVDEVSATGANEENHQFVPAEWIEDCIRVAPCESWRVILALCRYAGLRSHEARILRWEDVDLPNKRMIVRSNKNPPTRVCPISPDLLPHLVRARELAPDGAETVQYRYSADSNIQTQMYRIIDKAGLDRWPDVFQNLRRSCETELIAEFPIKDVAKWIGNSAPVAMKHYDADEIVLRTRNQRRCPA